MKSLTVRSVPDGSCGCSTRITLSRLLATIRGTSFWAQRSTAAEEHLHNRFSDLWEVSLRGNTVMSHSLQRLGKLLIKPPTWDRSTPAAPPSADKSGETHPRGGNCFSIHAPARTTGINTAQLVPDQRR
jgi:hypothetical protein